MGRKGPATEAVQKLIDDAERAELHLDELEVDPATMRCLEEELAPQEPEDYFGFPITVIVRH